MRPPFEPIHKCELKFLSWKAAFLLAITSARHISEIQALTIKEPYLQFLPDRVILCNNPFMPKVPSTYHLNEPIVSPTLFPNPSSAAERALHSLDIKQYLKFYLQRTEPFRKSSQLLISFSAPRKGQALTWDSIACWVTSTISFCHEKAGHPLLAKAQAHSTRKLATTSALFAGASLPDICSVATWANAHTFTKHYCLDGWKKADISVGQATLRLFA